MRLVNRHFHIFYAQFFRVVVVDAQTFLIPNFTYDGQAPDAHFWVGQGNRPGPEVTREISYINLVAKQFFKMSKFAPYVC